MSERTCKKCQNTKPISEFKSSTLCIECKKEYDKEYRKTDKVQSLYKSRQYIARKSEYQRRRKEEDPRIWMLVSAKARAKKLGLPFDITIDDIVIPETCPYLGIPLMRKECEEGDSGFWKHSPSLDRIIPELGYVKGNIEVISMKANAMKSNASIEELLMFSKNVLKKYDNTDS
jgi:hypothetical protein